MLWIYYALATMASFAGADFFIKKASGKVDDFYGAVILNLAALVVPLIFFLYQKQSGGGVLSTKEGLLYMSLAGVGVGIASITFLKMFGSGANLSIGSPIVRIGTIVIVTLLGIFVLRESLSTKQILGLALSLFGIGLLVFK